VQNDTSFAKLVSLGCHDVRTPLATVHGFAKTLERASELVPPADRYVEMIEKASEQMAELLDELPAAQPGGATSPYCEADTLALAQAAQERLGEDRVRVAWEGQRSRPTRGRRSWRVGLDSGGTLTRRLDELSVMVPTR
jgi:hypothetical protein